MPQDEQETREGELKRLRKELHAIKDPYLRIERVRQLASKYPELYPGLKVDSPSAEQLAEQQSRIERFKVNSALHKWRESSIPPTGEELDLLVRTMGGK